jgi:hypothetical protein
MPIDKIVSHDLAASSVIARPALSDLIIAPRARFHVECCDAEGRVRWVDVFDNLVTTQGRTDLLEKYFRGSTYTASWFVGLIDSVSYSAIAAGDTAASHSGWTEATAYTEANRPAFSPAAASAGSLDNSASKATFSINATKTIKGAFVISNSTKGGTTGILYNAALFSGGDRSVVNGDTLAVQATFTVN